MKYVIFALLFGLFAGSAPDASAENLRPEILIHDTSADKVRNAIVGKMIALKGFRLVKDSPFALTFDGPVDSLAVDLLFATPAGGSPVDRINFVTATEGTNVRVVADMAIISNEGTGLERRTDTSTGADAPIVQGILDDVRKSIEERSAPGKDAAAPIVPKLVEGAPRLGIRAEPSKGRPGMRVGFVDAGGAADIAGIQVSDVILLLDEKKVSNYKQFVAAINALKGKKRAKAKVLRDGKTYDTTLEF